MQKVYREREILARKPRYPTDGASAWELAAGRPLLLDKKPQVAQHGAACAMLLTVVDISGMSAQEAADATIDAVRKLPADVEIPHKCNGLVAEDLEQLATDAMADACFPGNPRKSITIRQSSYSVNHGIGER